MTRVKVNTIVTGALFMKLLLLLFMSDSRPAHPQRTNFSDPACFQADRILKISDIVTIKMQSLWGTLSGCIELLTQVAVWPGDFYTIHADEPGENVERHATSRQDFPCNRRRPRHWRCDRPNAGRNWGYRRNLRAVAACARGAGREDQLGRRAMRGNRL